MIEDAWLKSKGQKTVGDITFIHEPCLDSNAERAASHYRRRLLSLCGFGPWLALTRVEGANLARARQISAKSITSRAWRAWRKSYDLSAARSNESADKLRAKTLLRATIRSWRQYSVEQRVDLVVASRHSRKRILRNAIMRWRLENSIDFWSS